jgi:hypothetical protein
MKFHAHVVSGDNTPLDKATVEMVGPAARIARGKVTQGRLSLVAEPTAVWGLLINGQPVAALVAAVDNESTDLGEIVLVPQGLPLPLFHAREGLVFGAPRAMTGQPRATRAAAATDATLNNASLTFGGLVGSVAQQLNSAVTAKSGLSLIDARVSVKGVPTASNDALSLAFPTAEIAATGIGLSELSFTLRPQTAVANPSQPNPPSILVPDLIGYTRDLAVRKLAKLGLIAEISTQVVVNPKDAGRVLRQSLVRGAAVASGAVVRLFVGKHGAA